MLWTTEQVNLLTALWNDGKPVKEITEILGEGFTRNSVIGKAHRIKLEPRQSPIKKRKLSDVVTSFMKLSERQCKWPYGDPRLPGFHFCGKPADVSVPYCEEHTKIAYVHPAPKKSERISK